MSYRAVYLWLWFLILCTVLLFSTSFHYPTPLLNPPFLILLDIKTIRMCTHIADILWSVILFYEFLNTSCLEKEIILKYGLFVLYVSFFKFQSDQYIFWIFADLQYVWWNVKKNFFCSLVITQRGKFIGSPLGFPLVHE